MFVSGVWPLTGWWWSRDRDTGLWLVQMFSSSAGLRSSGPNESPGWPHGWINIYIYTNNDEKYTLHAWIYTYYINTKRQKNWQLNDIYWEYSTRYRKKGWTIIRKNVHPWPAAWKVENGTNINGVSNKNWEDLVYLFVVDGQRILSTKQVTLF